MFWKKTDAFTLLEVMLAVAVMSLACLAIYRFVDGTLAAVAGCRDRAEECVRVNAFFNYIRHCVMKIPEGREGALLGEAHRFDGVASDELTWIAAPGSGLLTEYAAGEWSVTLTLRELEKRQCEIGLRRRGVDRKREAEWLPLLDRVRGLEFRFFDPGRKEWMEKWTDEASRPSLVRVKLWRDPLPDPETVIIPVPPMVRPAAEPGSGSNVPIHRARVAS